MKSTAGFLVCALLAVPAAALTVTPSGAFSATGKLALGKGRISTSCDTTFTGTVSAEGRITINTLTFRGGLICGRVSAHGLPWSGRADSDRQLTIEGMQVEIRAPFVGGVCGPVDVVAAWDNTRAHAHFRKVVLPPDCHMDGVMVTTPAVVVTP
jgi:hypothetical protein